MATANRSVDLVNGYAGKILRLDLSKRKISTIATSDYEQWGGGHGVGSAIFFDLVKDKAKQAMEKIRQRQEAADEGK